MKRKAMTTTTRRLLLSVVTLLVPVCGTYAVKVSDGGVDYSLTAQALAHMTDEVVLTMGYVVGLLYAIASLLAIYNATVIYIKLNAGEEGLTKSVLMLLGAVMFLIGATIVLPSFFGFSYGGAGWSSPFS